MDLIAIGLALASATGAVAYALTYSIPGPPCPNTPRTTHTFTIVADLGGYNGSRYQEGSGPLMRVHRCDWVEIRLVNHDVQAHGLAVDFYAVNGVEAVGGGSEPVRLPFLATKSGEFRVYCTIVCSVHNYMQHGQLSVCNTYCGQ